MTPPLLSLLAEFRRDSAERRRGVRRYYLPPSERRKVKAMRARQRVRPPDYRGSVVIRPIRPIKTQEVINAARPV
jgi:hypothetical protein